MAPSKRLSPRRLQHRFHDAGMAAASEQAIECAAQRGRTEPVQLVQPVLAKAVVQQRRERHQHSAVGRHANARHL
jgi:hypothetical protein